MSFLSTSITASVFVFTILCAGSMTRSINIGAATNEFFRIKVE